MKEKLFILVIIVVAILLLFFYTSREQTKQNDEKASTITSTNQTTNMNLTLTSSVFQNNGSIPSKYTCDGENIIPPLEIGGVGPEAKSLTLIMDDPDAASVVGHTFDHWVKFNIDPSTRIINEGMEPGGIGGKNGAGELTYTGPCPPNGPHHYYFKLYALDTTLNIPEGSSKEEVERAMEGHILAETQLVGIYER